MIKPKSMGSDRSWTFELNIKTILVIIAGLKHVLVNKHAPKEMRLVARSTAFMLAVIIYEHWPVLTWEAIKNWQKFGILPDSLELLTKAGGNGGA